MQRRLNSDGEEQPSPDIDKVADAVGEAEVAIDPIAQWTCESTGLVLGIKQPPQMLLNDIAARVKKPPVPTIVLDDETGQTQANPDDPAWAEALLQWAIDRSEAVFAGGIAFGVSIKHLPEGMEPPESDVWIDELQLVFDAMGDEIQIAREPPGRRFYHWVRYYAVRDEQDLFALTRIVTARVVLTEEEVREMVGTFRRMAIEFPDRIGAIADWVDQDADSIEALGTGDRLGI